MKRALLLTPLAWLASSCLLLTEPPEFAEGWLFDSQPQCEEQDDCPDGWVCDEIFGDCEQACVDEDCPGGHVCDEDFNDCDDYCIYDSDCRAGYRCCEYEDRDAGLCDFGECISG